VDDEFRSAKEYILFDRYLQTIGGGIFKRKVPPDIEFAGSSRDREILQHLIIREELARSLQYIRQRNMQNAERELRVAKGYADSYPYLNFLLAGLKYRKITQLLIAKKLTNLDEAIDELETAKELAQIGARDKTSKEPEKLVTGIGNALTFFYKLKEGVEKHRQEVSHINEAIKEFSDIMEEAKAGITSIEMLNDVSRRMKALQEKSKSIEGEITVPKNKEVLAQLTEGINRNIAILKSIQEQTEFIQNAHNEYQNIRESAKREVGTEAGREKIINRLEVLKQNITSDFGNVTSVQGKDALKKLTEAITRDLQQLREIKGTVVSPKDNEILENHFNMFKNMMDILNKGTAIKTYEDLKTWVQAVGTFLDLLESDKNKLSSPGAVEALSKLIDNVRHLKSQLESKL